MQEGKMGSKVRKEGNKTRTFWDFSEKSKKRFEQIENIESSDLSTVAHEMRHQYDRDINNDTDNLEENTAKDPSEIRAVNNENRARKIEKISIRTTYGGEMIDPELLRNPPNNK